MNALATGLLSLLASGAALSPLPSPATRTMADRSAAELRARLQEGCRKAVAGLPRLPPLDSRTSLADVRAEIDAAREREQTKWRKRVPRTEPRWLDQPQAKRNAEREAGCLRGDPEACFGLVTGYANLLAERAGHPPGDIEPDDELLRRERLACEAGEPHTCRYLADALRLRGGAGVEAEFRLALRRADALDRDACERHPLLCAGEMSGDLTTFERAEETIGGLGPRLLERFEAACRDGHSESCAGLAVRWRADGRPARDWKQALWRSCDTCGGLACAALGRFLEREGRSMEGLWFRFRGCDSGHHQECASLMWEVERGTGPLGKDPARLKLLQYFECARAGRSRCLQIWDPSR